MSTLGDAVTSLLYSWSKELSNTRRERTWQLRRTIQAIADVLKDQDWMHINLERLLFLDASLTRWEADRGASTDNQARCACNCRKILAFAVDNGFTCHALTLLNTWNEVTASLQGVERGLLRLVEYVGMRKTTFEATEEDFEAARIQLGMAVSTADTLLALFRSKMRQAQLESLFTLMDVRLKRDKDCADPVRDLSELAQLELAQLEAFLTTPWVPGRDAGDAVRAVSADHMSTSIRMLHAHAGQRTKVTPDSLRDLVVPANVIPWIDHMQNDKHRFRKSVWAMVGPLHAIAVKHPLFRGMDFDFILERIGQVPVERSHKRTERKEEDAIACEELKDIPDRLLAQSQQPGLKIYQVARLRRNAAIASMLLLFLRQRNVRSCELTINLKWRKITNRMAHEHDLEMPDCVRAAWNNNKQQDFLMLMYPEEHTKEDRWELVILPLATAAIIDDYIQNHRKNLIPEKHQKNDKGFLFPSKRGGALAKSSMWSIVRYMTKATVGTSVHPHLWRSILISRIMFQAAIGIGKGFAYAQRCSWQVDGRTTEKYADLEFAAAGTAAIDQHFQGSYAALE
ncbi:MAG: hypothetical protein ACLGSD_00315 [Acidobacteriota bacterium]